MPFRSVVGVGFLVGMLLLIGVAAGLAVWLYPGWLGIRPGSDQQQSWLWAISATTFALAVTLAGYQKPNPNNTTKWHFISYVDSAAAGVNTVLQRPV